MESPWYLRTRAKTKEQAFGGLLNEIVQSVRACGEYIATFESSTYLDSIVHIDGGSKQEDSISQGIWRCQHLYRTTVFRIFKSLLLPVLLYACEPWTLNIDLERRVDAFGNRYQCRITEYRWNDFLLSTILGQD